MKRIVGLGIIFIGFLAVALIAGPQMVLKVKVQTANVRLEPDMLSGAIAQVPLGTLLESSGKVGDFYQISITDKDGKTVDGFIHASVVEVLGAEEEKVTEEGKKIKEPEPMPEVRTQRVERTDAGSGKMSIGLKLSGGAAFLFDGAGDLEKYRTGKTNYYNYLRNDLGDTTTFNWKKLSLIPDFNAEIIFNITPNFGIGIGSGIINATSKGNYSSEGSSSGNLWYYGYDVGDWTDTFTDKYTQNFKIQAIPITLNLYYFAPLGDSLNFYIYGGVGYYMGKLTRDFTNNYTYFYEDDSWYYWNEKEDYKYDLTAKEESKQNKVGFKTGLGLEMNMGPSISLGLEVFGRFVNFNNWEGDYSDSWTSRDKWWHEYYGYWYYDHTSSGSSSEHGNLWIYDTGSHGNKGMWILENKPDWSNISNVNKAAINLNAFGAQISLRFHFDL